MTHILTTERLTLRPIEKQDWAGWHAYHLSDRAEFTGGPGTASTAWRSFATEIGHWHIRGYGMWAVCEQGSDDCMGFIGPWYPLGWPEREVGWMLFDDRHQGKGYAFEAARAAVDDAFTRLGWDTVVSYIAPNNLRSRALAERLGAVIDPDACPPSFDKPCFVYRHPRPEDRA